MFFYYVHNTIYYIQIPNFVWQWTVLILFFFSVSCYATFFASSKLRTKIQYFIFIELFNYVPFSFVIVWYFDILVNLLPKSRKLLVIIFFYYLYLTAISHKNHKNDVNSYRTWLEFAGFCSPCSRYRNSSLISQEIKKF